MKTVVNCEQTTLAERLLKSNYHSVPKLEDLEQAGNVENLNERSQVQDSRTLLAQSSCFGFLTPGMTSNLDNAQGFDAFMH